MGREQELLAKVRAKYQGRQSGRGSVVEVRGAGAHGAGARGVGGRGTHSQRHIGSTASRMVTGLSRASVRSSNSFAMSGNSNSSSSSSNSSRVAIGGRGRGSFVNTNMGQSADYQAAISASSATIDTQRERQAAEQEARLMAMQSAEQQNQIAVSSGAARTVVLEL